MSDHYGLCISADHVWRQMQWSAGAFGPGDREAGIIDHMTKEFDEVRTAETPEDKLAEWVDLIILAFDGAWRCGATPEDIIAGIKAKQARNEARVWPDWRTAPADKAIEHDRSGE